MNRGSYALCPLVSLSVGSVTEYIITFLTQVEQSRGYAGMWWRERVAGEMGRRLPEVSGDGIL